METLTTKISHVTGIETPKLFNLTEDVQQVEVLGKFPKYLMGDGREIAKNFMSELKFKAVSTVLEANGTN